MITNSTGLEWKNEENNGLCSEVIPHIQQGFNELCNNEDKYKKYEAANGWGTTKGCKKFFTNILQSWQDLNLEDPVLAEVATFWIT